MHTVLEIKFELLRFFRKSNSFNIKNDHSKIDLGDVKDESLRIALIYEAMKQLCEQDIIKEVDTDDDRWYVLAMPLEMLGQEVEINYETAFLIAQVINEYCRRTSNKVDVCDVDSITELDIQKLLRIMDILVQDVSSNEN